MVTPLRPRDYLIEEYTTTVCPHCFLERGRRADEDVFVDGMLVSHDGAVWMRRVCPQHGETESLYEENAELWRARNGWSTPTLQITPDRPGNFKSFPEGYREGLPAGHGQHTCILLLNITDNCNYSCPTCYASAKPPGSEVDEGTLPSIEEIECTVTTMLEREGGKLGVLMLSGGEPTVRKDLEELLCRMMDLNVTRILINTNGRRMARDDGFLKFLQRHRDRIEVYLQFDGFEPRTYLELRGEDVAAEKVRTVERLNEAGLYTTLVTTVKRGLNEHEVGAIVKLGLATPKCAGIAFQPVFGSGRNSGIDPLDRVTPTGVMQRIGEQTGGVVSAEDFIPLPCSHRDCCDITYMLKNRDGQWQSLPKLLGREELKKWIHLVSNTISFDTASGAVKEMLKAGVIQRVFSEQQKTSAVHLAGDILNMCACVPGIPELLGGLWSKFRGEQAAMDKVAESTFRITVKMFMDANTFHSARIRQCCVHTGTFEEDPRRYSFCWRWLFEDATDFPSRFESLPRLEVRA